MSEFNASHSTLQPMLEQINAPGAFQTELLYAMSHPEEYITIDANHQPRPSRLLRQCLDLFAQLIQEESSKHDNQLTLYQKAKAGAYRDPKGTFVLVKLDEDDDPDFESVLQKVSQTYNRAWFWMFRVDEETTRKIYQENPNAAFLDPGRQALHNMVIDMDQRIIDGYKALFAAASYAPDYAAGDTELLEQLRLYAGCINECPDPFSPYLTLIRPMNSVFGTRVGDDKTYILDHLDEYAGIFVTPALGTR